MCVFLANISTHSLIREVEQVTGWSEKRLRDTEGHPSLTPPFFFYRILLYSPHWPGTQIDPPASPTQVVLGLKAFDSTSIKDILF